MDSATKFILAIVISKVISLSVNPPLPPKAQHCLDASTTITATPHQCCVIPDLMTPESYASCGDITEEHALAPSLRGSADCEYTICMFRNNDMISENQEIDHESVRLFLDEFAQKYRKYLPAVNAAKETCVSGKPLFGPPEWCEVDKLVFCINNTFYAKCPDWLETEECTTLRGHLEDCMPYYNVTSFF